MGLYRSGSAFNGNRVMGTRPLSSIPGRSRTNFVSLSDWCRGNFISKRRGTRLIERKMLIATKKKGQWWVCANPYCMEALLSELGVDELLFDADNSEPE